MMSSRTSSLRTGLDANILYRNRELNIYDGSQHTASTAEHWEQEGIVDDSDVRPVPLQYTTNRYRRAGESSERFETETYVDIRARVG